MYKHISDIQTRVLIEELETRGYSIHQVHNTKWEALAEASYEELAEELESRGYSVKEQEDKFHDFLFELYYDCVWRTPEQFIKGLNEVFKKELNKQL